MLVRIGCRFEQETAGPAASLRQVWPQRNGAHCILTDRWEPPAPAQCKPDPKGDRVAINHDGKFLPDRTW